MYSFIWKCLVRVRYVLIHLTSSCPCRLAGYVEATVIPRGARNIRVEEVAGASNFLALANDQGEYYLNGHWFIQWSGDYEMAGTVVRYDREGNKESFRAQGPLKEPLHIMVSEPRSNTITVCDVSSSRRCSLQL